MIGRLKGGLSCDEYMIAHVTVLHTHGADFAMLDVVNGVENLSF